MDSNEGKPFVFPVMKKSIEELFMNGTTTKEDVERFQEKYWEQMVPNFSQALKILDLHDNINDRLLEAVKSRIQAKAAEGGEDKKNQKLWQKLIRTGMAYIHHPYMRSAIMMVLGQMNSIKSRYVSLIVDNDYLYRDAPLPVLRHIWMANQTKYKEEIMNVLHAYQSAMSEALLDPLLASVTSANVDTLPILYWPQRRRRKDPSLMKIVEMIGENETLYEKALEIFREESARYQQLIEKFATRRTSTNECSKKFTDSKSSKGGGQKKDEGFTSQHLFISPALLPAPQSLAAAFLCTFRFDLLMSFNEAKLDRICVTDPIHHFVWCMDACIKSKRIDRRHASELAVHLNRHRRHNPNRFILSSEVGLDQDTSEDWAPDLDERGVIKKSMRTPTAGEKHALEDVEEHFDKELATSDYGTLAFERDIQIVCRDPWVVYTVCSSLLRVVITGLYEDKSPKSISEVPFLVHLLMRGLESDLCPPEMVVSKEVSKSESKYKRSRRHMLHALSSTSPPQSKSDPATILITQVLPAAAQLHVTTWRSQVCEEIRSVANRIWPKSGGGGGGSDSSHLRPSTTWQRRLDAAQPTSVVVSPAYLAHPVGHLFLQYHALFALERREWTVFRALLKAAVGAAQARPSKSFRLSKSAPSPTPASANQLMFGFRWRPECLQAVSLGIASLPLSSEESTIGDGTSTPTPVTSEGSSGSGFIPEKSSVGTTDSSSTTSTTVATSPLSSVSAASSTATNAGTSIVTRAELASLLRTSLPLQSDLQLLVLAQCAKLVPTVPSTPTTPGSAGAVTPMPNFFTSTELAMSTNVAPRASSERERLLNALSRHVEYPPQESSSSAGEDHSVNSPPLTPTGFKSSNAKVVEALESLRRELERCTSAGAISMMGTSKPTSVMSATPLSPLSGGGTMSQQQCGMVSPSRLMPPPIRSAPRSGGARYGAGMGAFPMATPLTNPGLSMPPPPPPLAPQPGKLLTSPPLADYRPPSPSSGASSAVGSSSIGSSYPTYATPMVTDMGEGGCGLGSYSVSLSPTGDLSRYAAPMESHSPTPPLQPPASP